MSLFFTTCMYSLVFFLPHALPFWSHANLFLVGLLLYQRKGPAVLLRRKKKASVQIEISFFFSEPDH